MNHEAGQNATTWERGVAQSTFTPLANDARADVCVIGAGMAGLCTAYELLRAGHSVIVLDDGEIGGGQTSRTSAHLSNAIDARYFEIARMHGEDAARLVAQSHTAAIDRIERIALDEGIECEFERVDGYLVRARGEDLELLERELGFALRAGIGAELVARAPIGSFDTGVALRFPRQAQFHPAKFIAGLAEAIVRRGGTIHAGTHVTRVHGQHPVAVETTAGPVVTATSVVVATNVPINDRVVILTKQAAYTTYVVAARITRDFDPLLLWDTAEPYHYVRCQRAGSSNPVDLVLVGGEDHRSGQADDATERFERLEAWARERFPSFGPVVARWSGQVMEAVDGLAFIGRNPLSHNNVYVVTGDCGQGLTHGAIAGLLLTDLILDCPNPWAAVYDPARKSLHSLARFAEENVRTLAQYADWFTVGERKDVTQIAADEGAVVRRGLHKVAAYRDEQGVLHEFSAVCPHLGGIVRWNAAEKTWDCPCHGSRFDALGHAIVGPANSDLKSTHVPLRKAAGS